MALQIRRGTEAERLTITPLPGEVLFTTDLKQLFIGDGTTVGGVSISEQAQDAIASLVSGSHTGIYFTYNDAGNALTATVTGGMDSLDTLTDVAISGLANDQILKYAPGVGWINGTIGIDVLNDVNIVNPETESVLKYNGTNWVNGRVNLDSLSDVAVATPALNEVITHNGTNWVNGNIPFSALTGVSVSGATNGQVLKFNGTLWVAATDEVGAGGVGTTLDSLTDVILTGPIASQTLRFDGTNWVNQESDLNSLPDVVISTPTSTQTLRFDGTNWVNEASTLDSLPDVIITSPVANEAIRFDGTHWINSTHNLDSLSDVVIATPVNGQTLRFDGTNWVNSTVSISVSTDTAPALGGNLDLATHSIFGNGSINITGAITATAFTGEVNTGIITAGTPTVDGQLRVTTHTASPYLNLTGLTTGSNPSWIDMAVSRGTHAAPTATQSGDQLGGLILKGYATTDYARAVALAGLADGAPVSGKVPGKFAVVTTNSTGTGDNYLTFDSKGVMNAPVVKLTGYATGSLPASPEEGWMAFDSTTKQFKGWDGTAWVVLG